MAEIKLPTSLTALLGADMADADLVVVWDASAEGWVKMTRAELIKGLNAFVLETVSGTSRDLADADAGKILVFTSASAVTLNLPAGLVAGFQVGLIQKGAGKVSVVAAGGVTLTSYGSLTKTAGAGAVASLTRVASNDFVLGGTLGA